MQNLVKKFDGYKTYGVAVVTVVYGAYQTYIQTGSNWKTFVPYLLVGGGLGSLRAAIKKVEAK